jgi:hypothetical protein
MSAPAPQPVRLSSEPVQLQALEPILERVRAAVGDVPALLAISEEIGRTAPQPGEGNTAKLWELLASVTAVDVAAGRVLEPHLDAPNPARGRTPEAPGESSPPKVPGSSLRLNGMTPAPTSSTAPSRGARSPLNWTVP